MNPPWRGTIEARVFDFGNQSISGQFRHQTSDMGVALNLLNASQGRFGVRVSLQVFVAKAVKGMLASRERREDVAIGLSDGNESGATLPLIGFGMAKVFGSAMALSVVEHRSRHSGNDSSLIVRLGRSAKDWRLFAQGQPSDVCELAECSPCARYGTRVVG